MAGLVWACLALAGLLGVSADHHQSRYDVNKFRLDDLNERLDELSGHQREDFDFSHKITLLESQLAGLEDNHCGENQFSCGPKCVYHLLVCDGKSDCEHGEDEAHCDNPVSAGTVFSASTEHAECGDREIDTVEFSIVGEKRYNWFPTVSQLEVHAKITAADGTVAEGEHHGIYSYGLRKLVVYPTEGGLGLGMTCDFLVGSDTDCEATFKSQATLVACGHARMSAHH